MSRLTKTIALAFIACAFAHAAHKAPYHVLYSNDTTHISSSPSPHKNGKENFSERLLRASVDEVKGENLVQMLQPGLGWVPWWKSEVVPINKHIEWLLLNGKTPNSYEKWVANGGDMIAVFLDECRKQGQPAFISIRVNDTHHVSRGTSRGKTVAQQEEIMTEFQFFAENKDSLVGEGIIEDQKKKYALDFAKDHVRAHKLAILEEICKNYDIDGLELDLMRHWVFFNPTRVAVKERARILTEFVGQVRQALDKHAPNGKHRWLCVRIPGYIDTFANIGIDVKAMAAAGVDMFNLSGHYYSDLQMQVKKVKEMLPPEKTVYAEMHYVNAAGPQNKSGGWMMRRTTAIQMYTNAHLVYSRGADGVSLFNFPYYRGTYNQKDAGGASAEPPFEALEHIGNPEFVAKQPQQYFLGYIWDTPKHNGRPLRAMTEAGKSQKTWLDMAPPKGGWQGDGKLRIQSRDSLGQDEFEVIFNGEKLAADPDVSDPFLNPYSVAIGKPEDYRAFTVPLALMKDGINTIEIAQKSGKPHQLFYLDVSIDHPEQKE